MKDKEQRAADRKALEERFPEGTRLLCVNESPALSSGGYELVPRSDLIIGEEYEVSGYQLTGDEIFVQPISADITVFPIGSCDPIRFVLVGAKSSVESTAVPADTSCVGIVEAKPALIEVPYLIDKGKTWDVVDNELVSIGPDYVPMGEQPPAAEAPLALRYNTGKSPVDYILAFPHAVEGLARVLQWATDRPVRPYPRFNFLKGAPATQSLGSGLRHLFAWYRGVNNDVDAEKDGQLINNLYFAAFNFLRLAEELSDGRNPDLDDRPTFRNQP